jgi:hypothetical protein
MDEISPFEIKYSKKIELCNAFKRTGKKWKPTITHQDYDTDIKIKSDRQPGKFQNSCRFYRVWVSPTPEPGTAPSDE